MLCGRLRADHRGGHVLLDRAQVIGGGGLLRLQLLDLGGVTAGLRLGELGRGRVELLLGLGDLLLEHGVRLLLDRLLVLGPVGQVRRRDRRCPLHRGAAVRPARGDRQYLCRYLRDAVGLEEAGRRFVQPELAHRRRGHRNAVRQRNVGRDGAGGIRLGLIDQHDRGGGRVLGRLPYPAADDQADERENAPEADPAPQR